MAVDITALYCCLDDFCKVFDDWRAHRLIPSPMTRQRSGKLSRSDLPHYDRFVSLMPRLFAPLMVLLQLHSLTGEPIGVYFADSSKLAVCHNRRIHRHKVFDGLAARGKTTMGKAGQRFQRRSRWNGQTRVVLRAQAAPCHQPQEPYHGAEDHVRQHRRQHRARFC